MFTQNAIAQRLWSRIARAQRKVQKSLIKKADELHLSLLTIDMMTVIRDNEKVAIANVLPQIRPIPGQMHDFALLYLDLPTAWFAAGFYRLQITADNGSNSVPNAVLADADGNLVQNVRYIALDIFSPILGVKNVPAKKLAVFETFHKTNESYVLGGTRADGQAFVIVLDL